MGFILNVIDGDGKPIPFDRLKTNSIPKPVTENGCEEVTIQILEYENKFTLRELKHIRFLLVNAIEYGASESLVREYIELLDKIDKISEKKTL